jgi:predicted ATPase
VQCLGYAAWALWLLGYPDQALKKSQKALTLAKELSHSVSLAAALFVAVVLHHFRQEWQIVQERTEALITLSTEHGFAFRVAQGTIYRGSTLVEQGQVEEGSAQIRQGMAAYQATGAELWRPYWLALLAEAYGKSRQREEGLTALAEALALVNNTGERMYEAELYRLRGELTLAQSSVQRLGSRVTDPRSLTPDPQAEAEGYFLKAIAIARKQQAKSLELRAVMSLVRLWQQEAVQHPSRNTHHETRTKLVEARRMLSEIYDWFTEGFDTKDLQEAKGLLEKFHQRGADS